MTALERENPRYVCEYVLVFRAAGFGHEILSIQ
jgi:hypothetical protein